MLAPGHNSCSRRHSMSTEMHMERMPNSRIYDRFLYSNSQNIILFRRSSASSEIEHLAVHIDGDNLLPWAKNRTARGEEFRAATDAPTSQRTHRPLVFKEFCCKKCEMNFQEKNELLQIEKIEADEHTKRCGAIPRAVTSVSNDTR